MSAHGKACLALPAELFLNGVILSPEGHRQQGKGHLGLSVPIPIPSQQYSHICRDSSSLMQAVKNKRPKLSLSQVVPQASAVTTVRVTGAGSARSGLKEIRCLLVLYTRIF